MSKKKQREKDAPAPPSMTIDAILAQLTPKRKVEEMDADIVVLKAAVKMLTQEVAELKKAQ